uniref:Uncharacterized protein n=1 Tax=Cannabis sativa TaxID=3483 RepID=A0A803PGK1_CANSA
MNTKTMRLPPRRLLPSNTTKKLKSVHHSQLVGSDKVLGASAPANHLLAGYLAHEFLTKGTLFGQAWDSARAGFAGVDLEEKKKKREAEPSLDKLRRYVAVADLLSGDGTHLPGIVNPTQLARLLQL